MYGSTQGVHHICVSLIYFNKLVSESGYVHLAGTNSTLNSCGIGTVKAKTVIDKLSKYLNNGKCNLCLPDLRKKLNFCYKING